MTYPRPELPNASFFRSLLFSMDEPRRVEGLLNEQVFERSLHKDLGPEDEHWSFGWHWTEEEKKGHYVLYKICTNQSEWNEADKSLLNALSHLTEKAYLIVIYNSSELSSRHIGLSLKAWSLRSIDENSWLRDEAIEQKINSNVQEAFTKLSRKQFVAAGVSEEKYRKINDFVDGLSPEILRHICLYRLVVNFGLGMPVDIDGVVCDSHGKLKAIAEFKRKETTNGPWLRMPVSVAEHNRESICELMSRMSQSIEDIARFLRSKNRPLNREAVFRLLKANFNELGADHVVLGSGLTKAYIGMGQLPYEHAEFVGLDRDHVRTAFLCAEIGIEYRYIIWLSDVIEPEQYYSKQFVVKQKPSLKSYLISEGAFKGFTYTTGGESGSLNKGARVQAIIQIK